MKYNTDIDVTCEKIGETQATKWSFKFSFTLALRNIILMTEMQPTKFPFNQNLHPYIKPNPEFKFNEFWLFILPT